MLPHHGIRLTCEGVLLKYGDNMSSGRKGHERNKIVIGLIFVESRTQGPLARYQILAVYSYSNDDLYTFQYPSL
jgi:hypothetical protein